jgi:hypothetical protein
MKRSELSFEDGFFTSRGRNGGTDYKAFDWDLAASIIKKYAGLYDDLVVEAGLQGDWNYTGGVIFENGKPTNDSYTYLKSNWAVPTLILSWDGEEQEEIECWESEGNYSAESKWDEKALKILEINL